MVLTWDEDVLNRMVTKSWREAHGIDDENNRRPADRDGAFEARHLSKYIFPLQYSLNNAFSRSINQAPANTWSRMHFWNREGEIKVNLGDFFDFILLMRDAGSCKGRPRLPLV